MKVLKISFKKQDSPRVRMKCLEIARFQDFAPNTPGLPRSLVSARLVEAENFDWRLLRDSDQRLIKWFGKVIYNIWARFAFKLGHATFPTRINCLNTTCINSLYSQKLHFLPFKYNHRRNPQLITLRSSLLHVMERGTKHNQPWVPTMKYNKPHKYSTSGGHFYPGAHLGDFQCYKGRKCMFCDSWELIGCCM